MIMIAVMNVLNVATVFIILVSSRNPLQGRLEVLYRGKWGTVCSRDFDDRDARVACYMLGFGYERSVLIVSCWVNPCCTSFDSDWSCC